MGVCGGDDSECGCCEGASPSAPTSCRDDSTSKVLTPSATQAAPVAPVAPGQEDLAALRLENARLRDALLAARRLAAPAYRG